jgi:DNA-binding response OmpR family regulator
MSVGLDPKGRINFTDVTVLILEQSDTAADLIGQIFGGFGARNCLKATSVDQAAEMAGRKPIDLAVVEPELGGEDGLEFVRWLRRSASEPSRSAPVIVTAAATTASSVHKALGAGANFFVAKPISSTVVMQRIQWVIKDARPFVDCPVYAGPDRRFKMVGPPPGSTGRRGADITTELGDASEPNLTQNDIDMLIKPQKVSL